MPKVNSIFKILFIVINIIPQTHSHSWTNWSGNQHCYPTQIEYPKTLEELTQIITFAVNAGHEIRPIGRGHSRSNLMCTNGYLVSLENLNQILSIDHKTLHVRTQAGITLTDLNRYLAQEGLALPNQPAISEISLAGAISTATHGGGQTASLSSFVLEIELITSDGAIQIISRERDLELFKAAATSLGALGIIYAVTLQCVPLVQVKQHKSKQDLKEFLKIYKKLDKQYFHFKWNTQTDTVTIREWEPINDTENIKPSAQPCSQALTWHTPDDNNKDIASEIAIPFDQLPQAISIISKILAKHKLHGIEIAEIIGRFTDQDKDSLLSPCCDGQVVYLSITTPVYDKYLALYQDIEESYISSGENHIGERLTFLIMKKPSSFMETI
ncbi:MAG TPA: FAD-binding protein [Candidatus Babeliaceae bacterium]|nr:FAD-binding protein [Candidatus Babeliaceae bacterium]